MNSLKHGNQIIQENDYGYLNPRRHFWKEKNRKRHENCSFWYLPLSHLTSIFKSSLTLDFLTSLGLQLLTWCHHLSCWT